MLRSSLITFVFLKTFLFVLLFQFRKIQRCMYSYTYSIINFYGMGVIIKYKRDRVRVVLNIFNLFKM